VLNAKYKWSKVLKGIMYSPALTAKYQRSMEWSRIYALTVTGETMEYTSTKKWL
jgi:hypothetical protein